MGLGQHQPAQLFDSLIAQRVLTQVEFSNFIEHERRADDLAKHTRAYHCETLLN